MATAPYLARMHLNKRAQVLVCSFLAACNPCYTLQTRKLQSYHLTDAKQAHLQAFMSKVCMVEAKDQHGEGLTCAWHASCAGDRGVPEGPAPPPSSLLSMRSGAVGINLTAANHVFLMEPAFNPALEAQAIGRAHRMGQTRPVTVKKFYIKVCSTAIQGSSSLSL